MNIKNAVTFCLLYLSLTLLLCSELNAATRAFGITFAKATEDSLKYQYPDMIKNGSNRELNGTIYEINSGDFMFDGVRKIYVLFDQQKKLIAFLAINKAGNSGLIRAGLAKKYKVILNYKSLIGSRYMELYNEGVSIYLISPLFSLNSLLLYIRTDMRDKILKNLPEETLQSESDTMHSLVEHVFPSAE